MQVIVFASQKGGSGKTTLAGHMAVMADAMGLGPVAMLDTDPQGSLAQWWNARQAETPYFVRSSLTELPETLAELDRRGINMVMIDTPPAITIAIRSVVENADLVVVPVRPSPHDLRAAGATVDLVEGLNRPFVFVVNAASARARITSDAAVALSQHGTVAPTTIHNRTEYAASMSDGRTVMEINPEGRSAHEMQALWAYLKERVERAARMAEHAGPQVGGAFSDFVRESYDPRPQAATVAEGARIPVASIDPARVDAVEAWSDRAGRPDRRDSAMDARSIRVVESEAPEVDEDEEDTDGLDSVPFDAPRAPTANDDDFRAERPGRPMPHLVAGARPAGDRGPAAMPPASGHSAPGARPASGRGLLGHRAFGRRGIAEV
ncbi:ParA family protein [Roseospira navarrensis]|uniref:AAA family ATPase n=1 Tax=Roseospira navarrensis TaxID=140058 RepID=A0A7X2D4C0_9PROT|nr:ParA family protein [Roseospira navarrensis]MQX36040.1 AAA family ATPase [Roseospira navarrensis]